MQSLTHFAAGAAICRHVERRPLGLVLAVVSHFALDALPHFEDPSILPAAIAPFVGRIWNGLLWGFEIALVLVVVFVWRRFSRGTGAGKGMAAYLIIGGLLAVLPDVLTQLLGQQSFVGRWNAGAHLTWYPYYHRIIMQHREYRPMVALVCLGSEAVMLCLSTWLLFRPKRQTRSSAEAP
jgi:hypothetical protein